jgi:hypothetical protein
MTDGNLPDLLVVFSDHADEEAAYTLIAMI